MVGVQALPDPGGEHGPGDAHNNEYDLDLWQSAFGGPLDPDLAPVTTLKAEGQIRVQEKWYRNKDGTWRGYYVIRWPGIVRRGANAGKQGKLTDYIKGSRVFGVPKRTRGGRKKNERIEIQRDLSAKWR